MQSFPSSPSPAALRRRAQQAFDQGFEAIRDTIVLTMQAARLKEQIGAGRLALRPKSDPPDSRGKARLLTPRERSVLELVVQGKTTKRIAVDLGISFKTARSHRYSAMAKLGVANTAALVRDSLRMGIGS